MITKGGMTRLSNQNSHDLFPLFFEKTKAPLHLTDSPRGGSSTHTSSSSSLRESNQGCLGLDRREKQDEMEPTRLLDAVTAIRRA